MTVHVERGTSHNTPKKATQVKGDKMKVVKLNELKKVTKQLDKLTTFTQPKMTAKEKKINKLFEKKFKLREQLGIE